MKKLLKILLTIIFLMIPTISIAQNNTKYYNTTTIQKNQLNTLNKNRFTANYYLDFNYKTIIYLNFTQNFKYVSTNITYTHKYELNLNDKYQKYKIRIKY
jgi:hypothetical protein